MSGLLLLLVLGCTGKVKEPVEEPVEPAEAEAKAPPAAFIGPSVVVAARDLEVGHAITAADLEVRPVPLALGEVSTDPAALIGRVVAERLLGEEAVRAARLAPPGATGPEALLADGQVARALTLDDAGLARPGEWVDLLHTGGEPLTTTTALEAVRVLARGGGQITVAAPEGTALAEGGTWSVSLRNPIDVTGSEVNGPAADLAPPDAPDDAVRVVVAGRDLQRGVRITEADLVEVAIAPQPRELDSWLLQPAYVVGRVPTEPILAGELIDARRLADPGSSRSLSALVPRGMRAVAVTVDATPEVYGGQYVDVIADVAGQGGLMMQAVYVALAEPQLVLMVTPTQAEKVVFAQANPDVRLGLALRNDLDVGFVE